MESSVVFARNELQHRFAGWDVLHCDYPDFKAPNDRIKSFVTLIAQKPLGANAATQPF